MKLKLAYGLGLGLFCAVMAALGSMAVLLGGAPLTSAYGQFAGLNVGVAVIMLTMAASAGVELRSHPKPKHFIGTLFPFQ